VFLRIQPQQRERHSEMVIQIAPRGQHARFAAKEAVAKAFSTGIGPLLSWKSVSVYHGERMDPRVRLDEKGQALLHEAGATHVLLTLAHTDGQALAVAALVRAEKGSA
jgi:holo-[acyl-carrier protein] synthase